MGGGSELMRLGYQDSGRPTFVVIGHVARDVVDGSCRLGGTATYAALTAHHLGERVAIITSANPNLDLAPLLSADIQISLLPSAHTTTFENHYSGKHRWQQLHSRASTLGDVAVPYNWRKADVILLGPIAQEVPPDLADLFPGSLLGVSAQGWLRAWDQQGRVHGTPIAHPKRSFSRVRVAIVSDEDLAFDPSLVNAYSQLVPIFIVTRGEGGATVYLYGQAHDTPAFSTTTVDPTGAGDVFAAAYLIALHQTGDPLRSAHFAHSTASFAIEKPGIEGIPTMADVISRLHSRGIQW